MHVLFGITMNTQNPSNGKTGSSSRIIDWDKRVADYIKEKEAAMNIDWFELELEMTRLKLGICKKCFDMNFKDLTKPNIEMCIRKKPT